VIFRPYGTMPDGPMYRAVVGLTADCRVGRFGFELSRSLGSGSPGTGKGFASGSTLWRGLTYVE
jgi:hypothetical protein